MSSASAAMPAWASPWRWIGSRGTSRPARYCWTSGGSATAGPSSPPPAPWPAPGRWWRSGPVAAAPMLPASAMRCWKRRCAAPACCGSRGSRISFPPPRPWRGSGPGRAAGRRRRGRPGGDRHQRHRHGAAGGRCGVAAAAGWRVLARGAGRLRHAAAGRLAGRQPALARARTGPRLAEAAAMLAALPEVEAGGGAARPGAGGVPATSPPRR